jgi:anthranilate synthase
MQSAPVRYATLGGIRVQRTLQPLAYGTGIEPLLDALDAARGALFASGHEAPGRYSRWDVGFVNPPLELTGCGASFTVRALNARGQVLLPAIEQVLAEHTDVAALVVTADRITGGVIAADPEAPEEERLRRPTLLSVVRAVSELFAAPAEPHLGLYGAFGYDLAFQFEPIRLRHARAPGYRDLHLYLPDEITVVDHRRETAAVFRYEFEVAQASTAGLGRTGEHRAIAGRGGPGELACDAPAAAFEAMVARVREACRVGDAFEVVPSRVFSVGFEPGPAELFRRFRRENPSPYGFLLHLGDEALVGASPEMYVRVEGKRVETCPISGTVRRGRDAMEDADRIRELLTSAKDEAELTMCTDVDRNDKARVCRPGTVQVEGRRLIETYSRLFHTVDHVTGALRDACDGLDAFAAHMWACTLTGAPKPAAMQLIEDLEHSPRGWYGGAVGMLRFNGTLNTGITIRTVRLAGGVASLRVGTTVLYDSNPAAEEMETRLKAAAFLDALAGRVARAEGLEVRAGAGTGKHVVFVDNRDSFVHTLADYVRQTGARVTTYRAGFPLAKLRALRPDLVFISPGPGRPAEFGVPELVRFCAAEGLPAFGVCLGLQGMVEAFGGTLGVLPVPVHGKPAHVTNVQRGVFAGFPASFVAGRYHSLFAREPGFPPALEVTARSADGVIMGVAHRALPLAAVQFHPESILTLGDRLGHRLIENVVGRLAPVAGRGSPVAGGGPSEAAKALRGI